MPSSPDAETAETLERRPGAGKPGRERLLRGFAALLFLGVLALVLWGSLTPRPPELSGRIGDKLMHMGAYFALAGLAGLAFPRRLLWVAAGLVGFGVLVEIGQAVMPYGRHGTVFDGLANTLGVALATGLHLWGISPEGRRRSPLRRERGPNP